MTPRGGGFTLVELLLSVAIVGVIAAVGIPLYQSFQNRNDLSLASTVIAQAARRAELLAESSDGDSGWGIAVATGTVTVFQGSTYASRVAASDEPSAFSSTILVTGTGEYDFAKFSGAPSASGTTTLTSLNGETRAVIIGAQGSVGTSANQPPVAVNDSISYAAPPESVTFDPRVNDSDPDGDPLTITAVGTPAHGTVVINSGTSLTYTRASGYTGTDSFTYTISDGHGHTATASVGMTITAASTQTPPTAVNDFYDIPTSPYTITFDPRANDYDTDGDSLTITAVQTPAHGTATINGGTSITYNRTSSTFYGDEIFTYTISDGHGYTATASIDITIEQPSGGGNCGGPGQPVCP